MTEIAFHFGAPDKLGYTCRLLRKAVGSGATVAVVADEDDVAQLDAQLWALSPTDFVAHCTHGGAMGIQIRSPVLLLTHIAQASDQRMVLVNLAETMPEGFDKFERVIEVVSTDAADRDQARTRWRKYTELGYPIKRHDLALKHAN